MKYISCTINVIKATSNFYFSFSDLSELITSRQIKFLHQQISQDTLFDCWNSRDLSLSTDTFCVHHQSVLPNWYHTEGNVMAAWILLNGNLSLSVSAKFYVICRLSGTLVSIQLDNRDQGFHFIQGSKMSWNGGVESHWRGLGWSQESVEWNRLNEYNLWRKKNTTFADTILLISSPLKMQLGFGKLI